jgi:hypothetical protein
MSTTTEQPSFLRPESADLSSGSRMTLSGSFSAFRDETDCSIRYSPAKRKSSQQEGKTKTRILRRMTGFLVEMGTQEARVAFIDNGQQILYDLPADQLRKSGVEIKNQPFQMDEIEVSTDEGLIVGYRFQPLAKKTDAYIETLNFDKDRRRKRALILKEFSKAKA